MAGCPYSGITMKNSIFIKMGYGVFRPEMAEMLFEATDKK
jgi:hypothetical protein